VEDRPKDCPVYGPVLHLKKGSYEKRNK